jgi:hypothetical protein
MHRSRDEGVTASSTKLQSFGPKIKPLHKCKTSDGSAAHENQTIVASSRSSPASAVVPVGNGPFLGTNGDCPTYFPAESGPSGLPALGRQRKSDVENCAAPVTIEQPNTALHVVRAARKSLETCNSSVPNMDEGKWQPLDGERLQKFRTEIDQAASALTSRLSWLLPLEQQRADTHVSIHPKAPLGSLGARAVEPPPVPGGSKHNSRFPQKPEGLARVVVAPSNNQAQFHHISGVPPRMPGVSAEIPSNSPQDLTSLMEYVPPGEIATRISSQIRDHEASVVRGTTISDSHQLVTELAQFSMPRTLVVDSEIDVAALRDASGLSGKTDVIIPLFQLRKGMKMPPTALPPRFFLEKVVPLGICHENGQGEGAPHWDAKSRQWKM